MKKSRIVIGGGVHIAVERVADHVVLHKPLRVDIPALINEVGNAECAEEKCNGKYAQQKKRRDLDPELGL